MAKAPAEEPGSQLPEWRAWLRQPAPNIAAAKKNFRVAVALRWAGLTTKHLVAKQRELVEVSGADVWEAAGGDARGFGELAPRVVELLFMDREMRACQVRSPGGFLKQHMATLLEMAEADETPRPGYSLAERGRPRKRGTGALPAGTGAGFSTGGWTDAATGGAGGAGR